MSKSAKKWRAWLAIAVFIAGVFVVIKTSHTFQHCVQENRQQRTSDELKERVADFARSVGVRKDCVGEFIHKNGEAITAFFTVVLAIPTILLWRATNNLYEAGERQMKLIEGNAEQQSREMKDSIAANQIAANAAKQSADIAKATLVASNRPWVSLDTVEGVMISEPLRFEAGRMRMTIIIRLTNTGHLPALRTRTQVRLIDLPLAKDMQQEIEERQAELFDPLRRIEREPSDYIIFRGDKPSKTVHEGLSQEEIQAALKRRESGRLPRPGYISLALIIGIDYQSSLGPEHHQTRYAFQVGVIGRSGGLNVDIKPDAPPEGMRLYYFSSSAD